MITIGKKTTNCNELNSIQYTLLCVELLLTQIYKSNIFIFHILIFCSINK